MSYIVPLTVAISFTLILDWYDAVWGLTAIENNLPNKNKKRKLTVNTNDKILFFKI